MLRFLIIQVFASLLDLSLFRIGVLYADIHIHTYNKIHLYINIAFLWVIHIQTQQKHKKVFRLKDKFHSNLRSLMVCAYLSHLWNHQGGNNSLTSLNFSYSSIKSGYFWQVPYVSIHGPSSGAAVSSYLLCIYDCCCLSGAPQTCHY